MKFEVKVQVRTQLEEVFIDGQKVGAFVKLNTDNDQCTFVNTCPHEKLTGDHYILIGQQLNLRNAH